VSRRKKLKRSANFLAKVDLPTPAGPSIAITTFFEEQLIKA
jgi:hypothetical protein